MCAICANTCPRNNRTMLSSELNRKVPGGKDTLSPAHTMRFLSFVGRRDDEKTKIAWCVRTKDDRRSLILQLIINDL